MPPNLGGFFMVRSYYPSECHADYFDFERIEALKPAIEACGISTLSQSPMLGFQDLVHQQTQNQRYGSSHIGATAKDISNVVTDAASGVVDIFHGIDKAVADTWNNFWKDGKADG